MKRKNTQIPQVDFLDPFDRQLQKLPADILEGFFDTLQLLLEDPQNPSLRNHALRGKFTGLRSIDVTPDVRAIFKAEARGKGQIVYIFRLIGTHKELYS